MNFPIHLLGYYKVLAIGKRKLKLPPIAYFNMYNGSISHLPTGYMWSPHVVPKPSGASWWCWNYSYRLESCVSFLAVPSNYSTLLWGSVLLGRPNTPKRVGTCPNFNFRAEC